MNREQKAATIEALVTEIESADAVLAVDYRGISVAQVAELRAKLREADASFRVVKNSLTERAADQVGASSLKELLQGPTALTFVRGDTALAAKAIADYARATQLLPFKGGLMDGEELDANQVQAISRLPSREVLYGQLVGIVASPVTGLVRTLNALVNGLAVALGQVRERKEAGTIPAGESPLPEEAAAEAPEAVAAETSEAAADETPEAAAAETPEAAADETPEAPGAETSEADAPEPETPEEPAAEVPAEAPEEEQQEVPEQAPRARAEDENEKTQQASKEPAADDDNQANASAEEQPTPAEATKED